jgi:hypothetical protein
VHSSWPVITSAQRSLRCAETLSVRTIWRRTKARNHPSNTPDFGGSLLSYHYQALCTQNEANACTFWEWGTGGTNLIHGGDTQLGDDGDVDRAMGNVMPCEWRIWNDVVALSGRKSRHIHCFSPSCTSPPPFALVFTPVPYWIHDTKVF